MKVNRNDKRTFKSFSITITIETQEEAQALYAIFNLSDNIELFSDSICENIRKTIGDKYYNYQPNDVIANGITYDKFYRTRK